MFGLIDSFRGQAALQQEGAFLSVYEDNKDNNLYLTICRGRCYVTGQPYEADTAVRMGILNIPTCDGANIVLTNRGTVEFTYEDPQIMRVRTTGISLRIDYEPQMHGERRA